MERIRPSGIILRREPTLRERIAAAVPPIGPGLAVIATIIGIGLLSLLLLGGYFWSLHVAAQQARGRAIEAKVAAARQDVRKLKMEFEIRSRMVQLERWNAQLGLQPSGLGQYAKSPHQLDSLASADHAPPISRNLVGWVVDPCAAGAAMARACAKTADGRQGYTPHARDEMDSLIGKVTG